MAFKIIRPEAKQQTAPSSISTQPNQPEESLLETGIRNIARTGANIAALPGNILNTLSELKQSFIPSQESYAHLPEELRKRMDVAREEATGEKALIQKILPTTQNILPGEYGKPQGKIEEALDMTVNNLPFIYAFGATPFLQKLGADFAGSLASKGAEELGFGGLGQFIAGITGSGITNKLVNSFKKGGNPQALMNLAKSKVTELAEKAESIGPKVYVKPDKYLKRLDDIEKTIGGHKGLSSSEKKDLLERINLFREDANAGKITGSALDKSNKELNGLYNLPMNDNYRKVINSLQNQVIKETEKDIGSKAGKINKDWHQAVEGYRDITKAINFGPTMQGLVNQYPKLAKTISSPIVQSILGLGAGLKFAGGVGAALGTGGIALGKKMYEVAPFLKKSVTQELLARSIRYALEENIPQLTKTLHSLNAEGEKFEKEQKSGKLLKGKSSFKILRPTANNELTTQ